MNYEALALRLYSGGFRDADFLDGFVKTNEIIVRSLRPPERNVGGLFTSPATDKLPGTAAYAFVVVAKGFVETEWEAYANCASPIPPLDPDVGDVVILRTAHLEPLDKSLNLHAIKAEHVLHILPPDADALDDTQVEAHVALVKPEHMAEIIPLRALSAISLPRPDSEAA